MATKNNGHQTAAQLLIRSLVQQNVKYIFGIPGGKIMPTFDVLRDEGPQLIVCRHEQNAAFMAAAIGRLTGRPGVCLVTSGPGHGQSRDRRGHGHHRRRSHGGDRRCCFFAGHP
jgi:2-succinyl-5-enolpyruvyl-6-hydroxy-3-cyclohexene-1-carboxylate synthase